MEYESLRVWLQLINMVGTFGIAAWLYLERRNDKTNDRITELAARVDKMDKNVTALEALTENAPSHADLGKVYEAMKGLERTTNDAIGQLAGTVNQLVGENRGQTDTLRLILNRITERGLS